VRGFETYRELRYSERLPQWTAELSRPSRRLRWIACMGKGRAAPHQHFGVVGRRREGPIDQVERLVVAAFVNSSDCGPSSAIVNASGPACQSGASYRDGVSSLAPLLHGTPVVTGGHPSDCEAVMAWEINCDMGEAYGLYEMGDDEGIMPFITAANVACGFHAADPMVMRRTVRLAKRLGVKVGAHPSFAGPRRLRSPRDEDAARGNHQRRHLSGRRAQGLPRGRGDCR